MSFNLAAGSVLAILMASSALAQGMRSAGGETEAANPALFRSAANYPPMVPTAATQPADGGAGMTPRSCPSAGARLEQASGPAFEYLGADKEQPDLCRMRVGGQPFAAWFGIWGAGWAGGNAAYPAIRGAMRGPTGTVFGFDTAAKPSAKWHDYVRQEGIERIYLLGKLYRAMKLSHYREGFDGNGYRSVSTVWKDIDTGIVLYGNYQHIAGAPELDGQLIPAKITPAR